MRLIAWTVSATLATIIAFPPHAAAAAPRSGEIQLRIVDADTQAPIACRIHLKNSRGLPSRAPKTPFLKDHFVVDGQIALTLREGNYTFEAECGPEYHSRVGHFRMGRFSSDEKLISMKRIVDMAAEGWWSGDLYVRRPARDIELLMRAEDLHVAQLFTWSHRRNDWKKQTVTESPLVHFDKSRYYHLLAGHDSRLGGGLSLFHLPHPPKELAGQLTANPEFPPAVEFAKQARTIDGAWIEADTATAWDLPVWIAHGVVDSIRLADHRFGRDRYIESEAGQRPRNKAVYSGGDGLGRWSEHVYYQLLNCGLRIPPTAGSGSGDTHNPVGYNRVYVYCDSEFSYENWWIGLRAGRVMVTNGPLLRPTVEGRPPGHVFQGEKGKTLRLQMDLQLATKEKIEYLELIKNGEIADVVRLDEYVDRAGRLPPFEFSDSGWFLVRAVTDTAKTYRFATSGPFYVEFDSRPRISRRAVNFFQDWVLQRARQVAKLPDDNQRSELIGYHRTARDYWQELLGRANAD